MHTIAGFNSTNRWTDSLGLPEDERMRDKPIRFDEPTSPRFVSYVSVAAPNSAPAFDSVQIAGKLKMMLPYSGTLQILLRGLHRQEYGPAAAGGSAKDGR